MTKQQTIVKGKAEEEFEKMGEKLKKEQEADVAVEKKNKSIVLNQLIELRNNSNLSQMYSESAKLGSDNLSGELPLLKVHATGKSTTNNLKDGEEPNDGWFFYKPTGEQFEKITCHILTISKGFRAKGISKDRDKEIFNQIVGGVIVDGEELKPFITYLTGLKLAPMWDFGKAASKYTHAKPVPIPMFALTIKLTTEKVQTDYGRSWIIKFKIEESEDRTPILVMDEDRFQLIRDNVQLVEDTIASIIASKTSEVSEEIKEESFGNESDREEPEEAF